MPSERSRPLVADPQRLLLLDHLAGIDPRRQIPEPIAAVPARDRDLATQHHRSPAAGRRLPVSTQPDDPHRTRQRSGNANAAAGRRSPAGAGWRGRSSSTSTRSSAWASSSREVRSAPAQPAISARYNAGDGEPADHPSPTGSAVRSSSASARSAGSYDEPSRCTAPGRHWARSPPSGRPAALSAVVRQHR